jgi:hypothetical protein
VGLAAALLVAAMALSPWLVLGYVTATLALGAGYLFPLFGLIPVSVAIAVFKYRLSEIDRLINRTLVYGLVTALLGGVYAGLILLAGQLVRRPGRPVAELGCGRGHPVGRAAGGGRPDGPARLGLAVAAGPLAG